MNEIIAKASWGLLALVHVMPALVLFLPSMTQRLYSVSPTGDVGVLIVHRGALFLGIVVACLWAWIDPGARRALSIIVSISVVGFLFVYWRAGLPAGSLRTIAIADLIALLPLGYVIYAAWRT